jgi:hypothetical protein
MLDKLEEKIGEIHCQDSRDDIQYVINRLTLIGVQPEESILLVEKLYNAIMYELYAPIGE